MVIRSRTNGSISGTGTIKLNSKLFGGALITADGTNDATIVVRKSNEQGKIDGDIIFHVVTKQPFPAWAPIESGEYIYYSISGTNASAQLFEWES